jgi:hypothetical protein
LRTTLGPGYDPDNHPVTEWLDYYTRITLDRLEARNRLLDSLPTDIGVLVSVLADAGEPLEWTPTLLAARIGRLRTAALADLTGRSMPAARAELGRLTRAGWLEPHGATRGRRYAPAERLSALPLVVSPSLWSSWQLASSCVSTRLHHELGLDPVIVCPSAVARLRTAGPAVLAVLDSPSPSKQL